MVPVYQALGRGNIAGLGISELAVINRELLCE